MCLAKNYSEIFRSVGGDVILSLNMDDLHEKVKYPVISSSLSELYEDHFYFINSVPGVEQEGCIGVRGLTPDLATHVPSNKSLQTVHQVSGQRHSLVIECKVTIVLALRSKDLL
uniref:Eukaryotic peptide chain release factor subunit 1-1 n=1 Tax=Solanum tuberosum TaxID=4113 RepID=M1AS21_SOLTU